MPVAKEGVQPEYQNLMLIVGQLLEAARAASEGIKSLTTEGQSNSRAVVTIVSTIETIEQEVDRLSDLIYRPKDGGGLVTTVHGHGTDISGLREAIRKLEDALSAVKQQMSGISTDKLKVVATGQALYKVLIVLGWTATTGIAIYAAIGQWMKP